MSYAIECARCNGSGILYFVPYKADRVDVDKWEHEYFSATTNKRSSKYPCFDCAGLGYFTPGDFSSSK